MVPPHESTFRHLTSQRIGVECPYEWRNTWLIKNKYSWSLGPLRPKKGRARNWPKIWTPTNATSSLQRPIVLWLLLTSPCWCSILREAGSLALACWFIYFFFSWTQSTLRPMAVLLAQLSDRVFSSHYPRCTPSLSCLLTGFYKHWLLPRNCFYITLPSRRVPLTFRGTWCPPQSPSWKFCHLPHGASTSQHSPGLWRL